MTFQISFTFEVIEGTARLSDDFQADTFTVTMIDGQTIATLPIFLKDDQSPEPEESFEARLLSTDLTGGVVLGSIRECRVNIIANDYPNGLFGEFTSSFNRLLSQKEKLLF